jgi:hypothetical protein
MQVTRDKVVLAPGGCDVFGVQKKVYVAYSFCSDTPKRTITEYEMGAFEFLVI